MTTAIQTRHLGPTNTRGARIVAETLAKFDGTRTRVTVAYEYNGDKDHHAAAKLLLAKLGWGGQWHAGSTQDGFVYVQTPAGEFTFETEWRKD